MSQNQVVLVFGQKGLGKSYSIKRQLDRMPRHAPLYVWDWNREYAGDKAKDGIRDAVVFRSWPEFLRAACAQQGHLGRVVLQVELERFADFVTFCFNAGGATVVLDELHLVCQSHHPKRNRDALEKLLYPGRHRRINVIAAAWRPTEVPVFVRGAYDELRAFQTNERNDLQWYTDTCGANFANKLPGLAPRKCAVHLKGATAPVAPTTPRTSKSPKP